MIEIYANGSRTEFMVSSTCTEASDFLLDLAAVLAKVEQSETVMLGVLQAAMPIAYKLSGYKADNVRETRSLACGHITPGNSHVIATSG